MRIAITIKQRKSFNLIYGILLFVIFERLLESMGMPHSVIFLLDIANLYLFFLMIVNYKLNHLFSTWLVRIHLFIFLFATIIAVFHGISIFLIIWAFRNLLRFYVFFVACYIFLQREDIATFYLLAEKIFYLNFVILILQYLCGFRQDNLGGVFGTTLGANAYSNIFMLIICTYTIASWFEKKISTYKAGGIVLSALVIAVITETKIFLFEIVIIVILTSVLIAVIEKRYQALFKGMIITIVVGVGIIWGAKYIAQLYPNISNSDFLSIEGLKYILTRESGYTGSGDLNRLTAITSINKLDFFKESFAHRLFGIGLGGAEYSGSSHLLQSTFYNQYQYLHYYWFSHAWMYLECGYIGLIGYIFGFFSNALVGIKVIRSMKKSQKDTAAVMTGVILSIMTALLYIYNQSLRLEAAYMLYFTFAVIFIERRELNATT